MENNRIIKINSEPRCSITKLGEYVSIQSSPARRREIVKSQKYPPTYKVVTYTPATRVLVDAISGGYDDERLLEEIGAFYQKHEEAVTDFEKKQAKCSLDALRAYRKVAEELSQRLSGCIVTPGPQTWNIDLAGVTVSLRPELFVEFEGKNGVRNIGFVKFCVSKTHRLDEHAAGIINAVMAEKARLAMPNCVLSNSHILAVDIFDGKIFTAPVHRKRLMNEAVAACEEIAYFWPRDLVS